MSKTEILHVLFMIHIWFNVMLFKRCFFKILEEFSSKYMALSIILSSEVSSVIPLIQKALSVDNILISFVFYFGPLKNTKLKELYVFLR